MKIIITSGTGTGPTPLAAFDAALFAAGVANYNLIPLSSIIPPGSIVKRGRFTKPADEYGRRLYVVMAARKETHPGKHAWAGLGWTQLKADGRGLFVEQSGSSRKEVKTAIHATLEAMIATRGISFGTPHMQSVGVKCEGQPVCALAIAVFKSEGWDT